MCPFVSEALRAESLGKSVWQQLTIDFPGMPSYQQMGFGRLVNEPFRPGEIA